MPARGAALQHRVVSTFCFDMAEKTERARLTAQNAR
jgi:hypothetical protein